MGDERLERAQGPAGEAAMAKWGDPISPERQAELQRFLDAWAAERDYGKRKGPFHGEWLTGADVFWLAKKVGHDDSVHYDPFDLGSSVPYLNLKGANLIGAGLVGAELSEAHLEGANLNGARMMLANLSSAHLEGAALTSALLERARLVAAHLEGAILVAAHLEGAILHQTHLDHADLSLAYLEGSELREARLDGASLSGAHLEGAVLRAAAFDKTSQLNDADLDGAILDQVVFDNTNLTVIEWGKVRSLGDERWARKVRGSSTRARFYRYAARAYRSLSVALRAQGISAHATRFHYRAELMDRYALLSEMGARLRSRHFYTAPLLFLRWLGSWGLGTFAGYGDYVGRLFLTYAIVVCSFALAIFVAGQQTLTADHIRDALVLSVTSFHGRGLQPPGLTLTDAIATLAGAEAVFGLLIEGIFIAAFTRRVTGS